VADDKLQVCGGVVGGSGGGKKSEI
jgi:hypothetical protein